MIDPRMAVARLASSVRRRKGAELIEEAASDIAALIEEREREIAALRAAEPRLKALAARERARRSAPRPDDCIA